MHPEMVKTGDLSAWSVPSLFLCLARLCLSVPGCMNGHHLVVRSSSRVPARMNPFCSPSAFTKFHTLSLPSSCLGSEGQSNAPTH